MSRWLNQFENHSFQNTWRTLKDIANKLKADDETVVTSVEELARLRKVISYINGMINSIDPELVPMTTWDSFYSQTTACLQQVQIFIDNRNISHIRQANDHADNLLTYVRPYMIVNGKIGKILQNSIKEYSVTIDEYIKSFKDASSSLVSEIKEYKREGHEALNDIKSQKESIDNFSFFLFENNGKDQGVQTKINNLVEDFEKKYTSLNQFYNEIFIGDEDNFSTKKIIFQTKETALNDQNEITGLLENSKNEINELKKFYLKIFGEPNQTGESVGGLANELNTRISALNKFESDQKTKYEALNKEIESLLPGATSAGLARAYNQMKRSFDRPIRNANCVFYCSIGSLIVISILQNISSIGGEHLITFTEIGEWDRILKGLINRAPLYGAILWLAFYASKRRSESQRLQQEYAHKEAFAKSYQSYKKQLQDLKVEGDDLQKDLIKNAIEAIAYNASQTLDGNHGDKMPFLAAIEDYLNKYPEKVIDAFKTAKSE